jgi:RNA-directed DNA polymerase
MSTAAMPVYEWKAIPWRKVERQVFKLQTRIYRAARHGDTKTVHRLQRLLVHSRAAKLLAVRRVTQDNRGKRTAGVDGVKSLTPPARLVLAAHLTLTNHARPTRRIWIPKPGTTERRPLGIPTIGNRAAQALLKLVLEPEWEARFEPNSYGFRPGRGAHDAIAAIFNDVRVKAKYVLDADIAKCFDRIDQPALLRKLHTAPTFRRAIRAWLQAGVMDGPTLFPTKEGVPQGGVLSPLLANVALHGLETAITMAFPRRHNQWQGDRVRREAWKPRVVRYADDFVVLHQDLAVIEQAQQIASTWLADLGLELKPSKTRIVHTLETHAEQPPGFDFLGFTVRQFRAGQTHTAWSTGTTATPLGFQTLIRPSKAAMHQHAAHLRTMVHGHQTATQAALIAQLNPRIRGWSAYYRTVAASDAFRTMDEKVYHQLRRWAKRRHRDKSGHWIASKYWRLETGTWTFGVKDGPRLRKHSEARIWRHVKVRGRKSPYDGDWSYWAARLGHHPSLPPWMAQLLHQQGGRCAWCGLYFNAEDHWEIDHIIPVAAGGREFRNNQQLLHGHCHDEKTTWDTTHATRGVSDSGPRH